MLRALRATRFSRKNGAGHGGKMLKASKMLWHLKKRSFWRLRDATLELGQSEVVLLTLASLAFTLKVVELRFPLNPVLTLSIPAVNRNSEFRA